MASINAVTSPMHLYEDGELLTEAELRRRKNEAKIRQEMKPIGTMAQVSMKIAELDRSLQDSTQLVFDSRLSESEDIAIGKQHLTSGSLASAKHKRKEKELAEVNRFSGIYSIHTAVGQPPERIKYVHKISLKEKKKERKKSAENSRNKPKFVELFTFPGYNTQSLTQLPYNVTCSEIFEKVIQAQVKVKHMIPTFESELTKTVYSHMVQAILQDSYWWIFLERFSSQKSAQPNFFNRIAHNYVKLLLHIQDYGHRDAILNRFPELTAQSVYVAFCETFPDSYKQFDNDFKELLLQTLYEWMTGILPAPRRYLDWSPDLEPAGKKREIAMGKIPVKEVKKTVAADDWLAQIEMINNSQKGTLKKFGSELSLNSRSTSQNTQKSKRAKGSQSSKSEDKNIDTVAEAQAKPKYPRPPGQALSPVKEVLNCSPSYIEEEEEILDDQKTTSRAISGHDKHSLPTNKKPPVKHQQRFSESHPACKGPDMVHSLFDVKGSCPLVVHYLRHYGLDYDAGQKVHVSRTEMTNLPPLDAPTYKDVIKATFKNIKNIEKGIHRHIKQDMSEHSRFVIQQNKNSLFYRKQQALLLTDPKEVKRLSNLLLVENSAEKGKLEKMAAAEKLDKIFEQALLSVEIPPP